MQMADVLRVYTVALPTQCVGSRPLKALGATRHLEGLGCAKSAAWPCAERMRLRRGHWARALGAGRVILVCNLVCSLLSALSPLLSAHLHGAAMGAGRAISICTSSSAPHSKERKA